MEREPLRSGSQCPKGRQASADLHLQGAGAQNPPEVQPATSEHLRTQHWMRGSPSAPGAPSPPVMLPPSLADRSGTESVGVKTKRCKDTTQPLAAKGSSKRHKPERPRISSGCRSASAITGRAKFPLSPSLDPFRTPSRTLRSLSSDGPTRRTDAAAGTQQASDGRVSSQDPAATAGDDNDEVRSVPLQVARRTTAPPLPSSAGPLPVLSPRLLQDLLELNNAILGVMKESASGEWLTAEQIHCRLPSDVHIRLLGGVSPVDTIEAWVSESCQAEGRRIFLHWNPASAHWGKTRPLHKFSLAAMMPCSSCRGPCNGSLEDEPRICQVCGGVWHVRCLAENYTVPLGVGGLWTCHTCLDCIGLIPLVPTSTTPPRCISGSALPDQEGSHRSSWRGQSPLAPEVRRFSVADFRCKTERFYGQDHPGRRRSGCCLGQASFAG